MLGKKRVTKRRLKKGLPSLSRAEIDAVAALVHRKQFRAIAGRHATVPAWEALTEPERKAWRDGVKLYAPFILHVLAMRARWRP